MKHTRIYIYVTASLLVALAILFNFMPRSTFSEVERRELATFPEFSSDKLADGSWTSQVSGWYSDTEPYRDKFMSLHMVLRDKMGIAMNAGDDGEAITFHASDDKKGAPSKAQEPAGEPFRDYKNTVTADEDVTKVSHAGIMVLGRAPKARALMAYGGGPHSGDAFAAAVNKYHDTFGPGVKLYVMSIPNAMEYYCPDKAKDVTKPQIATIRGINEKLSPEVVPVDIYTPLGDHASEDIYLRTDHHWSPLGAFYAAEAFAKAAKVPFYPLSDYDPHVIHGYVGSMYGYSKDPAVKQSPEDFHYWTPRDVDYNTTYIDYTVDKSFHVTGEGRPHKGEFFMKFKDGSGQAYCTFMGGDSKITQVRTNTPGSRRVLIIKDSFGNAIPGYLFRSFQEIHVIDGRYFTKNIKQYVDENKITDVLFASSIFTYCSADRVNSYLRWLNN